MKMKEKNMLNWLYKLEFDETEKVIVLSHDYKVCIEEDLSKLAYDKFKQLGVDGIYSGHTHNFSKFEYEGISIVMVEEKVPNHILLANLL